MGISKTKNLIGLNRAIVENVGSDCETWNRGWNDMVQFRHRLSTIWLSDFYVTFLILVVGLIIKTVLQCY